MMTHFVILHGQSHGFDSEGASPPPGSQVAPRTSSQTAPDGDDGTVRDVLSFSERTVSICWESVGRGGVVDIGCTLGWTRPRA